MAIYGDAHYHGGVEGFVHWLGNTGESVPIDATLDPAEVAGVINPVGLVPLPGASESDNRMPISAIGESREVGSALGRHDVGFSMRHQVADASFIANCIRNRANPNEAGTHGGLKMMTVAMGIDSRYADAYAEQYLDSMINTWSFEWAEGQIVQADTELWAVARTPATPQVRVEAAKNVLIWSQSYMTRAGTDYHSMFSRVRLGGTNNLERVGVRHQFGAEGSELAISRTAYAIKPRLEQINLSYQLHAQCPTALRNSGDWGTVVIRAEHPVGTPNRRYFQWTIDHQYINRHQRGQAGANQLITFSLDQAAHGVEFVHGTL